MARGARTHRPRAGGGGGGVMDPWTLDADGWIYHDGRNVARVVTTPE